MTIIELSIGGVVIAMTGYLSFQLRKTNEKLTAQEKTVDKINEEFSALCGAQQGFGQRLLEAEKLLKKLIAQRQTMQSPVSTPQSLFMQAKKLLMLGASLDDIEKTCGLSKTESKLIAMTFDVKLDSSADSK